MLQRTLSKITQSPWHEGFLGTGHRASAVFDGVPYEETDPFILFMDDRLNLPGAEPVGGPHPHAGFETLTLVLKGNGRDWETGSFELMTAGKGIVHTEEITSEQNLHILQVWLALPPEKRWTQPFFQKLSSESVPGIKTNDYEIRVYSGTSNGVTSPLQNHTPLTLAEFRMNIHQHIAQELPADYNGLIYVLNGSVQVGNKIMKAGQAGWLNTINETGASQISFHSLSAETHFVLYAARPHKVPVVQHGPFLGDTKEDISKLYKAYRNGEMPHLNSLPEKYKVHYTTREYISK